jgi:hypothetical protein
MQKPAADNKAKRTSSDAGTHAHERDFFFDELMTAQPDATREYLRERLKQQAPNLKPPRKG